MDYCECKATSVDLEEFYCRTKGEPEVISRKELVKRKWVNKPFGGMNNV